MRDFAKRQRGSDTRRFVLGLGGALLLLVLTILMVRAAWGMYGKFASAAQSDELAQKQLQDARVQQAQVSASVHALTTERGLEAQVRERFGVGKPGEGQIQIVRDSAAATTTSPAKPGMLKQIWDALFGWL